MRLRQILVVAALTPAAVALLPAVASAAPPLPFGHACTPQDGALFCPATTDAQRVPSFDGVPLDVDVWLPATGDGPFPTIDMIHGWGGNKTNFENNADGYSAQYYARKGYAVVLSTARGFGRSCGAPDSRTSPGCDKGWIRLGDARYEVRDQQTLLGMLVDEGIAKATALGATGISYGGGTSLQMAYLKDRIRNADRSYSPWTTPKGTKLSLAAAWPRWPWSDLADALVPNGRSWLAGGNLFQASNPPGVELQSWQDLLFTVGQQNYLAPKGADPEADLITWKARLEQGEPFDAKAKSYLKLIHDTKGASGIALKSAPAPLLIQSGWTDDLFPAWQGARAYQQVTTAFPKAVVSLQLGDLGHPRAANHTGDNARFAAAGLALFGRFLGSGGAAYRSGSVVAFGQSCPRAAANGIGPWTASTVAGLARGALTINAAPEKTITTKGIDKVLDKKLDPLALDPCVALPAGKDSAPGVVVLSKRSPGVTLIGSTAIALTHPKASGSSQIVARLWDLDPKTKKQRLVDRSVTRPVANATKETLRLNGNAWRFAKGHTFRIELVAGDPPTFRPSNGSFSLRILTAQATIPTREPGRR
jgi:pimeloyl-ACP methyl ester carboxylesterase